MVFCGRSVHVLLWKWFEATTGWQECTLALHSDAVNSVGFSPKGTRVVSGSQDGLVWQVRTLTGHSRAVRSVSFSLDGKHIVSGSRDTLVQIWEVETGAEVSSLAGER